jgi:uncharacterized protein with PQ loop repeat
MKKIIKAISRAVLILWLLSAIALDSVSYIPIIVCAITTLYLGAVILIKQERVGEVL